MSDTVTTDRIEPSWSNSSTTHRCADGSWQPGRTRNCEVCGGRRPVKVKRRLET